MKTNFHNKNFALSLAFIVRFKVTRKWSIHPMVKTSPKESRERNGEKAVWNPAVYSSAPPPNFFIRAYSDSMFRVFFKEKLRKEVNCNFL